MCLVCTKWLLVGAAPPWWCLGLALSKGSSDAVQCAFVPTKLHLRCKMPLVASPADEGRHAHVALCRAVAALAVHALLLHCVLSLSTTREDVSVCIKLLCLSVHCSCGSRRDLGVGAVQQVEQPVGMPGGSASGFAVHHEGAAVAACNTRELFVGAGGMAGWPPFGKQMDTLACVPLELSLSRFPSAVFFSPLPGCVQQLHSASILFRPPSCLDWGLGVTLLWQYPPTASVACTEYVCSAT